MESEPILKKTLVTVGAMVGAWVAFVGTASLVAVLVTSHVVGPSGGDAKAEASGSTTTASPSPDPLHPAPLARPNGRHAHDSI